MVSINIVAESQSSYADFTVNVVVIALKKSYLTLITDQPEYGIGTVILGSPPVVEGTGATSSPLTLFGLKNSILSNMIGKTMSRKLTAPVLAVVFIKNEQIKPEIITKTTMDAVLDAVDQILKKSPKNQN
jgi:hypothetical protein